MSNSVSRREFLCRLGAAGGSTAIYQASVALGLASASQGASSETLFPLLDKRPRVVVLGAGISGLACVYQLERAGYDCILIEASGRIGGRNLTVRSGDIVEEMGNPQRCHFDKHPNLYFNAGPARIPANHHRLLDYCKTLGVELEVFIGENRHALVHDTRVYGGKPMRMQEYVTDARGFMTELLTKSVHRDAFESSFSNEDAERLFEFLRHYGDLDEKGIYKGSSRSAFAAFSRDRSMAQGAFDFSELLKHTFWQNLSMHITEYMGAPLMQAVGGNDQIVRGFIRHIKSPIITGAPVQDISLTADGVNIVYQHKGRHHSIHADYCLNSIPFHLLPGIHNNFSKEYMTAIKAIDRGKPVKVALQMSERFWEREGIYGGISYTDQLIKQLWYPSQGIHSQKGVMLGAYTYTEEDGDALAGMTPEQRIQTAIEQGKHIHSDFGSYVETGVSVPWHRMKYMMGCPAIWTPETRQRYFSRLQQPEGRHYLIGDQISDHPGWQEGALNSAHFALAMLNQRVQAEVQRNA